MRPQSILLSCSITILLMLRGLAAPPDSAPAPQSALFHHAITGLWLMGQSLCDGSDSLPLVTRSPSTSGALMFQRGVRTWVGGDHSATPAQRPEKQFALVPLMAAVNGGLGETLANGLADHLKGPSDTTHFLVSYAGQGGRTIHELSIEDESTDPRTPAAKQGGGGYYKTSLDDARRAVQQARAKGCDFAIAALVWMQGEANGGPTGGIFPSRWLPELPRPAGQEWYRDQLIAYRKQWSGDLRAITGQAGEIPLFTYQTLGPAGEAQLMAADRDPHIYMTGPHYMVPSALNGRRKGQHGAAIHLAADGERWYGEMMAKVMRRVIVAGENWQPLRPRHAVVEASRTSLLVDMIVPRPPLVLEEHFLARQQSGSPGAFTSLNGFRVSSTTGAVPLMTSVEVASPTALRIRFTKPLPTGTACTLSYGMPHAGEIGILASLRPGPETEGQPTTELLLAGDLRERLKSLSDEGAFYAANDAAGPAFTQTVVRSVSYADGFTLLRCENRELRNNIPFIAGQKLSALRPFTYGNVRDSDPEPALHHFEDTGYGTRAGQPYPLWNWCVLFSKFPIVDL